VKRGLLIAPLFLSGCLTFLNTATNEPVNPDDVNALAVGTDLQVCMDRLGAPIRVWETTPDRFAIAYGWRAEHRWRLSLGWEVATFVRPSITIDNEARKLRGAVLWFDEDMKLVKAKMGLLSDLLPPRRRPNDVQILEEKKEKG
jgi:hypothetical protein